ncbi:MAG: polyphosphate kinase 1 [Phycisphaerales bacterium]
MSSGAAQRGPSTGEPGSATPLNGHAGGESGRPSGSGSAGVGAPGSAVTPLNRPDAIGASRTLNRDLSWLEFNRRVLHQATDERTPLLERVRFLAIFSSNLDEFVMKRLGALKRRIKQGVAGPDQDGLPAGVLLSAMRATTRELQARQREIYENDVKPALRRQGIEILEYADLTEGEREWVEGWHRANVFPVLTPLSVDPGHRFPFISNLSRNFGVLLSEPGRFEPLFARVKVPSVLPQWVMLPESLPAGVGAPAPAGKGRFLSLRDVIKHNLDDLFPGMQITEVVAFRVTRDAEPEADEQDDDDDDDADTLIEQVEEQLRRRRFANTVRLEIGPGASETMRGHLSEQLELEPEDIDERAGVLDYTTMTEIAELPRADLQWPTWTPVVHKRLEEEHADIFSVIRRGDLLVHHPYESFEASAVRFISEAARDPNVLAIKQTIYRTSGDSTFVSSLVRAAESGKQVAVLVELRARFDEQRNVKFARMLEKAGAHVAYGVVGFKTHCKAALVVRREENGIRTYAHLGTGNYHPRTAQLYTDLGLFTCNPAVTDDVIEMFNLLTGRSRQDTFETVLVAPLNMKSRFIAMIDREIQVARQHASGTSKVGGRIVAKMNALADQDVTEKLYEASQAGVDITLMVRGFCCLRPGVPGLSENVRVMSVVGRFLEHSRFFHFGAGRADPLDGEWYIASADWMYRNLNNRVEAACPVTDRESRAKLWQIATIMLQDARSAWDLRSDGSYELRSLRAGTPKDSFAAMGTFGSLMREARR